MYFQVHLVFHPHRITPTFLKLKSWLPSGFIPIISTTGMNQINNGKCKKKISFMHTKGFIRFLKIWVQFCEGAIPHWVLYRYQVLFDTNI